MFLLMISFMVALALVLVAMPKVIPYLHKLKFGQVEREEGLAAAFVEESGDRICIDFHPYQAWGG